MSKSRKGYILPDDHEPEGYYCVPVYIPRDVVYLRCFFGALDFFGKWLAWDDDGDGRAAEAAAIWKIANELTRTAYAEGECGMFRRNPDDPCLIEAQDCEDPDVWLPVPIAGSAYDPRTDDRPPTPYPEEPEDGACIAAANATEGIKYIADRVSDILDNAGVFATLLAALIEIYQIYLSAVNDILHPNVVTLVALLDDDTVRADFLSFDWGLLKNVLVCYYNDDGTMTVEQQVLLANELAELATTETNQMWIIAHNAVLTNGPSGMTRAANVANITEAECEACAFALEWHFEGDDPEYTIQEGVLVLDPVSDTNVIAEECFAVSGYTQWRYKLRLELVAGTIDGIEWAAYLDNSDGDLCQYTYEVYDSDDVLITSDTITTSVVENEWTPRVWTVTPFAVPSGGYAIVWASFGVFGSHSCSVGRNRIDDIIISYE